MHKHSPCLNERHGMGSLAFEPADEAGGKSPQLNAGSFAFKGGVAHLVFLSRSLIFSSIKK
jgi:hypothetical protein